MGTPHTTGNQRTNTGRENNKPTQAKMLLGKFKETAGLNDVDRIGGDSHTSAYREGGKSKLSSIEDVWGTTLLIPPPDLVPMWGQIEDSAVCCGFMVQREMLRTGV